jgi:hypothetical protein
MTLDDVLSEVEEGSQRLDTPDGVEWRIGDRVFARLRDATVSFLLDAIVAGAALGTPDTRPSALGAGWVEFTPAELDRTAIDRAVAWFGAARRRAEHQPAP